MSLTFKEAKELSVKKWELLVKYDGDIDKVLSHIPELKNFNSECAMCQYQEESFSHNLSMCDGCIYGSICSKEYQKFTVKECAENANIVLERIIEENKKDEEKCII